MTDIEKAFALNLEDTTAKVMDGELVVIRLSDGTYYSMDNVGVFVWESIEAGHRLSDVVRTISARYGESAERVERDVTALLLELLDEGLIIPRSTAEAAEVITSNGDESVDADRSLTYQSPHLNIYRDMGNLLALDPPTPGIDDLYWGKKAD